MFVIKRTHACGELRLTHEGQAVTLLGWVHRRRDLGGLIFIDLRDREGITQVVFNSERDASAHGLAQGLNREDVVGVRGEVRKRAPQTRNPKLPTGEVELEAQELHILNRCSDRIPMARFDEEGEKTLPGEEVRLKYRYLDLRRKKMYDNLKLRHQTLKAIRDFLDAEGFLEVETPMLIRTTPEGARDYLVPSRLHPGKFYALPQSPQLFKQLLMVAGFEKYFQIARCLRDEDLRADRQPEFTQLDLEMSFVEREDILALTEKLLHYIFERTLNVDLPHPFPRYSYAEAMEAYGTDKPDLRHELKIQDAAKVLQGSSFQIFEAAVKRGEVVKAVHLPALAPKIPRKLQDDLSAWIKAQGGGGLVPVVWEESPGRMKSPLAKHLSPDRVDLLQQLLAARSGDFTFLAVGPREPLLELLGKFRIELVRRLELPQKRRFAPAWIVDFPMFQWNEEEKRLEPVHHPFTAPHPEDLDLLDSRPLAARADAYDIVMNGFELGSGSIRIHQRPLQEKIFKLIGLSPEEAREKFGFLLEAFQYGAPPHGGIAPGIDRLVMMMAGEESIREVIAFPKNQSAQDLMLEAPVEASPQQLKELHLKIQA